ncbi:class I SAM-dependent methyltransferase [Solibacillus daqui]|uniref:class I SAM-dependent methyltransferase n=1 Tax=Solibacillus daqui TaxID=2912187 RepID=UPI00236507BF|nr:class I SAM-dependent methyltransferase [Solibacillus daqui]
MVLTDPKTLLKWVQPHSIEWYQQLSEIQGIYSYSWNSKLTEPNGESIFDQEVMQMIAGKKVLDVGCGHGEFTKKCGLVANEIVGFDITEQFLQTGLFNNTKNVSFVLGNAKKGLPFDNNEFDCAYIRKGPTSAYPQLRKVIKDGGKIFGLHPGDDMNKELPQLFPNLFESTTGAPVLQRINQQLEKSNFNSYTIETLNSTEFIESPEDLLKLRCFGQHPSIFETLKEKDLHTITKIFEKNATEDGLPTTFSRYIVRATV